MRQYTIKIQAGSPYDLGVTGDYIRIKSANVDLTVEAPDNGDLLTMAAGNAVVLRKFVRLRLSHADLAEQTVTVLIGDGDRAESSTVYSILGSITVNLPLRSNAPTQAAANVTNASTQILAANAARSYLLIQNKHATATIWINQTGAAATTANGIKIGPGGSFESASSWVSTAATTAIGDVASNTDVVILEGN